MGLKANDILSTREAERRGLGNTRLDDIEVKGERLQDVVVFDYILPQVSVLNRIPKPLLATGKALLRFKIEVIHSKCIRCGLCIKVCPAQAIRLDHNKIKIDRKRCVLCMCCKETCPEGAMTINKSFMAKMVGI
jgi:ferredoxin